MDLNIPWNNTLAIFLFINILVSSCVGHGQHGTHEQHGNVDDVEAPEWQGKDVLKMKNIVDNIE